ncbi:MAG TPA: TetR/AcrR family transcriptional regulator [Plantibacter sp.]|uniref:TetR/AcrR family transcriptional regulator n=1 Tax=unclassified Plantibacter TaxID=2624265 RepID=UPI002BE11DE9|nr:TetR/AcrR family transcriptional regulator [Plantibacter sp.]
MSRALILDHIVDVIADRGLSGLTVRAVASSAGVAVGAVQHYYPSKTAMLLAAMDVIRPNLTGTHVEVVARSPADQRLRDAVNQTLPADPSSRIDRVWLAFAAHSTADEVVGAKYHELRGLTRQEFAILFLAAVPLASLDKCREMSQELVSLLDGLTVTLLAEPGQLSRAMAAEIATRHVDSLLSRLNEE